MALLSPIFFCFSPPYFLSNSSLKFSFSAGWCCFRSFSLVVWYLFDLCVSLLVTTFHFPIHCFQYHHYGCNTIVFSLSRSRYASSFLPLSIIFHIRQFVHTYLIWRTSYIVFRLFFVLFLLGWCCLYCSFCFSFGINVAMFPNHFWTCYSMYSQTRSCFDSCFGASYSILTIPTSAKSNHFTHCFQICFLNFYYFNDQTN